uniref:Uncharacterized protein n=1 Tax=Panagrolaimus superbus TaxID=310955 RepID=A0A914YQK3_9BILA
MFMRLWIAVSVLALFSANIEASSCGSGKFQNFMANVFIKLDCPSKMSQFNSCCNTHDSCYDRQMGQSRCDNAFCSCVKNAGKGTLCELDARKFCDWVIAYGAKAYKNAG